MSGRRARPFAGAIAAVVLLAAACAAPEQDAVHRSREYFGFRERFPDLLEPNYLPFMAYPLEAPPTGFLDALRRKLPAWLGGRPGELYFVFCRWDDEDLPLRIYLEPPEIHEGLDELWAREPEEYVAAVERALAIWEEALEGRVSFERVERARDAQLRLRLRGERAPWVGEDRQVLGTAALRRACRVTGGDPASGTLQVRYRVPELRLYVADQHGLLLPDQVERVALHEVGHALGMAGHSPVPADLMYEVARDRLSPEGLGAQDVHSFLSLYALPNGTVYRALSAPDPPPGPGLRAPQGPPRLHAAPHVDTRRGFEIQLPEGWTRLSTPYGVVAVDGTSWDYQASLQVVVRRYESLEAYLERYGRAHVGHSRLLHHGQVELAGARGERVVLATRRESIEEITFLAASGDRVVVLIAECPAELHDDYAPWLELAIASLEISDPSRAEERRDYPVGSEPELSSPTPDAAGAPSPPGTPPPSRR